MTTNRSCFTRIIVHKSLTVHRISTKFDTRIHLWTPVLCAKFQGDRSTRLRFSYSNFCKCAKRRRRKKKTQKFGCSYLGNGLSDFLQIWNVDSSSWRETLQQNWFQSDKGSPRYKGVNMTVSFFLSIYPQCGAPASWAARHTIVCLDRKPFITPKLLFLVIVLPLCFSWLWVWGVVVVSLIKENCCVFANT